MLAKDAMTREVIVVPPKLAVRDVARLMIEKRISGLPVVDPDNGLLGIVSEGDLIRRKETGTARPHSWWLSLLATSHDAALSYLKTHGGYARDVMTRDVVSVQEDTPVHEVASILEHHHIKRVPVLHNGSLVGIVSRADLIRALASWQPEPIGATGDRDLKRSVEAALKEADLSTEFVSVAVADGTAHLWGAVQSDVEKRAIRAAAENVPGVRAVHDHVSVLSANVRSILWVD